MRSIDLHIGPGDEATEDVDSLQQHLQFLPTDLHRLLLGVGPGEGIADQPFLDQPEANPIPKYALYCRTGLGAEDEQTSLQYVQLHLVVDDTDQAVDGIASIGEPRADVDGEVSGVKHHGPPCARP